ncbi:outer membrane beta-barrel protein [uncultured Pontibacter sp.]|uniref:outer membrane beta-barrel protein n=1 Tax=uncultured Pontibacter sp. TaxID=453356 RepID=UPI0026197816|nr:outer membrane beta-barrel protein [uncultured Pontibacter sp.]
MKKLLLSGLLAIISAGAIAQTTQGSISIGGSVGLNTYSTDDNNFSNKSLNINIYPSISYFVKDRLSVGLNAGLGINHGEYSNKDNDIKSNAVSNSYSIGVNITKYLNLTERLYFTASGDAGYLHTRHKNPDLDDKLTGKSSGLYISVTPGLTYFATSKIGLTASIGDISYQNSNHTAISSPKDYKSTSNQFAINLSPGTITIGIMYFLNR